MKKLAWIETAGGPFVLLEENNIESWSGILRRSSYLMDREEEADDFMDAEEADYGKACLVNDYVGIVEVGTETGLVLGEEPMPTAIVYSSRDEVRLGRWYYGEEGSEDLLLGLDWATVENWEPALTVTFESQKQYLFDSAWDGRGLKSKAENVDYLLLGIVPGKYNVYTAVYEPNAMTRFYLHKLVLTP